MRGSEYPTCAGGGGYAASRTWRLGPVVASWFIHWARASSSIELHFGIGEISTCTVTHTVPCHWPEISKSRKTIGCQGVGKASFTCRRATAKRPQKSSRDLRPTAVPARARQRQLIAAPALSSIDHGFEFVQARELCSACVEWVRSTRPRSCHEPQLSIIQLTLPQDLSSGRVAKPG